MKQITKILWGVCLIQSVFVFRTIFRKVIMNDFILKDGIATIAFFGILVFASFKFERQWNKKELNK